MKRYARYSVIAALALASCGDGPTAPAGVSLIGSAFKMADPNMGPIGGVSRTLLGATARGLVSFDANDQIQPALAERWIVTDDGLSYIFRVRESQWPDGTPVTSLDVTRSLKRSISLSGRNSLRALFFNVSAIIPMTGEVIEIRLKSPEPNFLQLLAQPEMAVLRSGAGTGPFQIHSRKGAVVRLRPVAGPVDDEEQAPAIDESRDVRVRAERAALAVARFTSEGSSYVHGGTFTDLPIAHVARIESALFQVDPAYGLFGLAASASSSVVQRADVRLGLSLAIDRDSLLQRFGVSNWRTAISVLPAQLDSSGPPAAVAVLQESLEQRRIRARALLPAGIRIRVAMPDGPGARLLFAGLAADWRRVEVTAIRVKAGEAADLYLIDEVAPVSSSLWYLERLSCSHGLICVQGTQQKLIDIFQEQQLGERQKKVAEADAALAASSIFIPLALPMRWSLVGTDMVGWRKSAFALHPLANLR
jgi:oligopeptide transport system substrate-binding protein